MIFINENAFENCFCIMVLIFKSWSVLSDRNFNGEYEKDIPKGTIA